MTIVPIILLGIACLCLGVVYVIFKDRGDWRGFIVRSFSALFLVIFAVTSTNLSSLNNAFSLFIIIALLVNLFYEGAISSKMESPRARTIIEGISEGLIYLCLALSLVSLSSFSLLAFFGGLLLGLGCGLLVWAIKKHKSIEEILTSLFTFISLGLMLGFGINNILSSRHMTSAIVTFISALLLLTSALLERFLKEGKLKRILTSAFRMIALIAMPLSIYLFA